MKNDDFERTTMVENDSISTGTIDADRICSEIGQEFVRGKATVIADRVTIRNGIIYYLDESLLDSGEASPSDSFSPPPCPAPQNPRDFSKEAQYWI